MREIRLLSSALAKKAANELNENDENIDYYLNALRDWVEHQQTHFISRTNDQFLITFLRSAKFSLEKAKQKLNDFYTYRAAMPELFCNRNLSDPKVSAIIKSGCIMYLPQPISDDGPRVLMVRPRYFDLTMYTIPDVFKVGTMAADVLLFEDDNVIVAGYVLIMDLANMPKSVLLNFDPNFTKKLTIMINKVSPTRMKGFHFLNVPPIFEKLFNMVKSVINVKLRERFYVHGRNMESLYEHIPPHILPKEYGGSSDIPSIQDQLWQKLNAHKDFIDEEDKYGVIKAYTKTCNGSKQFAKENLFGIEGSFRKLNID